MSNYWRKKWNELNEEEKSSRSSITPKSSNSSNYWQNKMDELEEANKKKSNYTTVADDDIAPVKTEEKRTWFNAGAFDDGYQLFDGLRTIYGSIEDVKNNVEAGFYGMGEKAIDAGATIIGGVGKLFGADDFAESLSDFVAKDLYDEEEFAKKVDILGGGMNPSFLARKLLGVDEEKDSVFGEKFDSVAQSGGQLIGQIGLQAVGVPWFVTSGVTSFGSEAESAFNEGATYGEAVTSGLVTAGAEILTEKISGGIKFGKMGTLDDGLTKALARNISNKAVRTAAKLGMDVAGEGAEEVFSGIISAIGQKITYADDKELTELFSKEDAWESFIGGAMLGGVGGVTQGIKAKTEGVDATSGLTANEEAVFKKIFDDRVAEAEKNGKKLSKTKLHNEILEQMEKGYISTDTIEEVLGGDAYKSYKDTVDSEEAILKEFEELGKKQNPTLAEQSRYAELKAQVEEIKNNSQRNDLKTKLSEEVFSLAKDSKLAESYYEKARRGQAFEADISKYDSKQQATIQSAIDSGILNNSRKTHEFVDMVAKISADKGVSFDFANNEKIANSSFAVKGKTVNAYVTKDGNITLNTDSPKYLNSVVGHEITHVLEGTELYGELQKAMFEYAKSKGEYDSRRKDLEDLYKDIEGANIDAELTADLVGDYLFTDSDFINNLAVTNRNVFQKIYDEIKYLYKVATAGSKEARELEKVKKAFEKAYKESGKAQSDKQYSVSEEGNLGYHAGDLGKAESLGSQGYGRGTGHFGRGTYFVGNKELVKDYNKRDGKQAPQHAVDFSDYNLYKVKSDKDGYALHDQLKVIDGGISDRWIAAASRDDFHLASITEWADIAKAKYGEDNVYTDEGQIYGLTELAKREGIEIPSKEQFADEQGYDLTDEYLDGDYAEHLKDIVKSEIESINEDYARFRDAYFDLNMRFGFGDKVLNAMKQVLEYQNTNDRSRMDAYQKDTLATVFMKSLGYEGVDTRGTALDNTAYGSVIYDLKENTVKYSLDKYTQKQYNNFGWARYAEAVSKNELDDLYSKLQEKGSLKKFTQSSKGEAIIEVNDKPYTTLGANNVFLFVTGTKNNPEITRVVRVNLYDEDSIEFFRKDIYERNDRRTLEAYARVMGEEFIRYYDRNNSASYGEYTDKSRAQQSRSESEGIAPVNRGEQRSGTLEENQSNEIAPINEASSTDGVFFDGKNPQYSLSDSDGKKLTKEQSEYFKDSKIKDENGNLLVMYHGTQKGGFTVFQNKRHPNTEGFYFTNDRKYSNVFQGINNKTGKYYEGVQEGIDKGYFTPETYEVYLDVKNPFVLTEEQQDIIEDIGYWENIYTPIKNAGYDGVMMEDMSQVFVFNSNQIKRVDNTTPTKDADIRYSLSKDSEGRELSPAVKNRFGNSKVVDENGSLKVVYHGTATGEFSVFDKSKGSVEGDFGSGFYFTDNEADVSEHYEGGGPDFENKVARRAEQIEMDEEIDYDEAEQRAREELYKGSHKFEVYLNIEKPAVVGETILFDSESYYEEYDRDDYDSDEDYEGDVEQLVMDDIDNILWDIDKNIDVYNSEGVANVLYEAFYNGGIGIEELKKQINDLYLENSNGELVGNEVTRQIVESLGYDGIIDPTVSGKWNMEMEEGTTHYIVFKPNQIKAVTNQNPTDNPDIHRSLSAEGETPKRYGNYAVSGKDIALEGNPMQEEIVSEEAAPVEETAPVEEIAPVAEKSIPSVLYTKRGGKGGWGDSYGTAQEAIIEAVKSVNSDLWNAFDEEFDNAEKTHKTPILSAILDISDFVRQETISPMQAAMLVSSAYEKGGVEGLKNIPYSNDTKTMRGYAERAEMEYAIKDIYKRNGWGDISQESGVNEDGQTVGVDGVADGILTQWDMDGSVKGNALHKLLEENAVYEDDVLTNEKQLHDIIKEKLQEVVPAFKSEAKSSFPNYAENEIAFYKNAIAEERAKAKGNKKPTIGTLKRLVVTKPPKGSVHAHGVRTSDGKQYMSCKGFFVVELNNPDKSIVENEALAVDKLKSALEKANNNVIDSGYEIDPIDISLIRKEAPNDYKSVVVVGENCYDIRFVDAVMKAIENPTVSLCTFSQDLNTLLVKGSNGQALILPVNHKVNSGRELRYVYKAEKANVEQVAPEGFAPIPEAKANAMQSENIENITDADAPAEVEAPYYRESENTTPSNPFEDRDYTKVGNPKVNSYISENPDAIPFFKEAATAMLGDLENSQKGERLYNDELYYESGGEEGFVGTKRNTTADIADLLDGQYHYTYQQIADALNAIINDGRMNACAKRVEFALNDRLMNGYTDIDGNEIPANQDYLNLLSKQQTQEAYQNSASAEVFTDSDVPVTEDIAPVAESVAAPMAEDIAPVVEKAAPEKAYEAIRPPKKSQEPKMTRVKEGESTSSDAEKTAEIYDTEPEAPKKKGSGWSWFVRNFVDKQHVFEKLALKTKNRELMAKADQMHRAESSAQWLIGHGTKNVRALNDIRKEVESSGLTKQFYEYMYHSLNVDRMTLEERYEGAKNKAVYGDSVTAEVSREAVANLEAKYPQFKKWAQSVYDYNTHLRNTLVESGVISQETADLWAEMYPHYVPIRRLGDSGLNINVPLDTGRTGVNAPVKRATGGNRDILPLFDTMAMRTEQTYKAIAKNRFGVELKNTLGTTIDNQSATVDEVIEGIEKHEELLKKGENGGYPTFTVFENGERVTFEISEEMYEALKPAEGIVTKNSKTLNTVNNIRRGLITEYNPVFLATNAIKDAQDIMLNSQHAAKTYKNIPKAIKELAKKGKWYREYMENGGEQNTYFDGQKNTFKAEDKGIKKIVGMPLRAISAANNFIERAPRLAEYIASREAGASVDVAMLDAARVTTNFAAGGDVTKWANRNGATFLNASVQGAAQQVRNIREAKANGLKGWVQLAAKTAAIGIPALLLNSLLWDDDEDYEELSDYVKDNYYIVAKYGDGQFVRIPKGRAVAVIQDAFEQIGNALTGDDEVDLKNFCELVINNLAPNNPIDNNIISPIVQAHTNKTWYGEELVPTRLQDLPNEEQYDESTDAISKWLGEKTGMSPIRLNYLLDQYSGGVGDVFLPMLTPEAERGDNSLSGNIVAPFKDKFTTDGVMNNQNVTDFYDTKDKLTVNAKASTATDEDILMSKYINSVSSDIGELYGLKREIQNSDLPDNKKYEKVRDIQDEINALARESLNTYGDVYIDGDYAEIGDRYYRLNDEGEWTKISDKQYDKQEAVIEELGISASDYWSDKSEYDFAYENPEKYAVAKTVGGYTFYKSYMNDLYDIKADKDDSGKSIRGSRKEKVIEYVNNLDIDYGERLILFKGEYKADDTYNMEIIDYLNGREDISYEEMVDILKELGFEVDSKGNITWD